MKEFITFVRDLSTSQLVILWAACIISSMVYVFKEEILQWTCEKLFCKSKNKENGNTNT
jgi:hypothetical protein